MSDNTDHLATAQMSEGSPNTAAMDPANRTEPSNKDEKQGMCRSNYDKSTSMRRDIAIITICVFIKIKLVFQTTQRMLELMLAYQGMDFLQQKKELGQKGPKKSLQGL